MANRPETDKLISDLLADSDFHTTFLLLSAVYRQRGTGAYAEMIERRFRLAAKKLGLDRARDTLRCDLFKPPAAPEKPSKNDDPRQFSLL